VAPQTKTLISSQEIGEQETMLPASESTRLQAPVSTEEIGDRVLVERQTLIVDI
jgi:hypothetical protein